MSSKKIDHASQLPPNPTFEDLRLQYYTGQATTSYGPSGKKHGYRNGVATKIGDIEVSIWQQAMRDLIAEAGESDLYDLLYLWLKDHNYANESEKELKKEALVLHSMRMFENEKWVGYTEFHSKMPGKYQKTSFLYLHQIDAVRRMKDGCILNGDVGSGKSRTGIYYYFSQHGGSYIHEYVPMKDKPRDLYIITTARKRDTLEWEGELLPFLLSPYPENNPYKNKVVIDSWNNIKKYKDVYGAFFIFDEQRVVGSGAWVKTFLNIARKNRWILLSATPGDTWMDYIPVFVANGFYKNKTEFVREHVVYNPRVQFPKVDRYLNEGKLLRLKRQILIDMEFNRPTKPHHEDITVSYDISKYKDASRLRWDPFKQEPIQNASGLCYVWRKIVNSDASRQNALLGLFEIHPKIIVFYNYDYELDILKGLNYGPDVVVAEWNGHKHEPVPEGNSWVYLVQYTAGCEGWNCITTDTIVFYSQSYSYKVMKQAAGRIDRLNTPFHDLYYYHLKSKSGIDLAISRALREKRNFNEAKYVGESRTLPKAA